MGHPEHSAASPTPAAFPRRRILPQADNVAAHVLVAAIGNPLRGDDGAAWRVAEHVERHWSAHGVIVLVAQQALPEWSALLAEQDVVYFVDAAIGRKSVTLEPLEPSAPTAATHSLGPANILCLARELFGRSPRAYLLTLPAFAFDYDESLSPMTSRAVGRGIRLLEDQLPASLATTGAKASNTRSKTITYEIPSRSRRS